MKGFHNKKVFRKAGLNGSVRGFVNKNGSIMKGLADKYGSNKNGSIMKGFADKYGSTMKGFDNNSNIIKIFIYSSGSSMEGFNSMVYSNIEGLVHINSMNGLIYMIG